MRNVFLLCLLACAGSDEGSDKDRSADATGDSETNEPAETPPLVSTTSGGEDAVRLVPTDLVTASPYLALRVEIDAVEGKGPDPEALDLVRAWLAELQTGGYLGKPAGIEVVLDETLPPLGGPDTVHTLAALDAELKSHAGPTTEGATAVVHALYVDGAYEGDEGSSSVLGFAYGGGYLVMMADNIAQGCADVSGLLSERTCELAEATVLAHELGHLFGLVDNGLPMVTDHRDPEHGAHDASSECLMYWTVERTEVFDAIGSALLGGEDGIKPLDEACLADLAAAQ